MPNSHIFGLRADHRLDRPCRLHFPLSKPRDPFRAVVEAVAAAAALPDVETVVVELEVVVTRHHRLEVVVVHRQQPLVVAVVAPPVLPPPVDVACHGNLRRDQWRLR
jgi:hypothetical protein